MRSLMILAMSLVVGLKAYGFDLIEDTFDFIFDDLAKVIGVIVIIAVIFYFVRKYLRKSNWFGIWSYNEKNNNIYNIM